MKIVSKFRDYYDPVGAYDREERPLYIRKSEKIIIKDYFKDQHLSKEESARLNSIREAIRPLNDVLDSMPRSDRFYPHVIAFCGKTFPCYKYYCSKETFWSIDDVIEFARISNQRGNNYISKQMVVALKSTSTYRGFGAKGLNRATWDEFQNLMSPFGPTKLCEISDVPFVTLNAPVLLLYTDSNSLNLVVNPELNKFNFAKMVEPYMAYQEIDMFLGNNLANQEDPNAHLTDELKVHYKGFDKKYGFRTRPKK